MNPSPRRISSRPAGIDEINLKTYRQRLLRFLYRLAGLRLIQSTHVPQDRAETLGNRLALRGAQGSRSRWAGSGWSPGSPVVGKRAQQRQLGELVRNLRAQNAVRQELAVVVDARNQLVNAKRLDEPQPVGAPIRAATDRMRPPRADRPARRNLPGVPSAKPRRTF